MIHWGASPQCAAVGASTQSRCRTSWTELIGAGSQSRAGGAGSYPLPRTCSINDDFRIEAEAETSP
eukprot:6644975-Alexandrium_andersonii.AAC.1